MRQTRTIWASGDLAVVLMVAACDRGKEPTQPPSCVRPGQPVRPEGAGVPASLREFKQ
jgi:hypothetical protein